MRLSLRNGRRYDGAGDFRSHCTDQTNSMNPRIYQRINRNVVPKTAIEWVLVLGILGMLGWMVIDLVQCELESRRGSAEARFDIAKADFKCRLRGKAHGWDKDAIEIAKQDFREVNFEKPIPLDKKYDLAMALEVAEHISQNSAFHFVDSLVTASDFVLFSAAIPFQGGNGHINEQWPDYWAHMFSERGYVALDFVRRNIWNDKQIPRWYRQNILLFVQKEQLHGVKSSSLDEHDNNVPLSLVHPDTYLRKVNSMQSVRGTWGLFRRALKDYVKTTLRGSSKH